MSGDCWPKGGLKRGAWTSEEDKILSDYIKAHGPGRWRSLPANAGLNRCGKSCRLRWLNYLRPDIKRGNITEEEEELIIRLHKLLGNRWSMIAGRLPGRTDNEIKNYWNTYLRRRAAGENAGRRSSPSRSKKAASVENSGAEAVRCARTIFNTPSPKANEREDLGAHISTARLSTGFLSDVNTNTDEAWIAELMQNSFFCPATGDCSYAGTESLQAVADAEIAFDEESYMRGLFRTENLDS